MGLRPRRAAATLCGRDREAIRANKSSSSLLIRASNRGEKRLTSVTRLNRKLHLRGVVVYDIECWYAGTGTARTERSDPGSIRIEAAVRRSDHWAGGPGMREHTLASRPPCSRTYIQYAAYVPCPTRPLGGRYRLSSQSHSQGSRLSGGFCERELSGLASEACCCDSVRSRS